ncbi:MAG: regulatory protein RecX [Mariniphaga sp.]
MNYRLALTKVMSWCSKSERCISEAKLQLRKFELTDNELDTALDYLVLEKFVDDSRYVHFYVNDKLRFNKWGKVKLHYMLRQQQINDLLINKALDEIDKDLYLKILRELLSSKMKSVKGSSDYERRGKLANYAQSHGFESDLAYRIANELIGGKEV